MFLNLWYTEFPEYRNSDLYIAGESYGGISVPWLAWKIDQSNRHVLDPSLRIPLKGIMVGNGCTDWKYDTMPATW